MFKKKDMSQIVAEEKILRCIADETDAAKKSVTLEERESRCRNIKALAEAYADINGWC